MIKQKTSKYIDDLSSAVYRMLLLIPEEYTFFLNTHGTLSKIEYILGHKTNQNTFIRFAVQENMFSDHNKV